MKKLKVFSKKDKPKKEPKPKVIKEKTTTPIKKKKLSNLYKFMLLIALIILTIVSFILYGTLITLVALALLAIVLFFTIVLDIYPKNSKMRKIMKGIFITFITLGIIGICCFIAFFAYIAMNAPDFDVTLLERGETTILYDKNNEIFATLGTEKRENVAYDDLPEVLIDALVATEDSRFFQHNGFDLARFVKASLGQIAGSDAGGASTLTMQVSKNNFTTNEATLTRKFTDIYLSIFKIEKAFTKQEIIEFYVNNTFLGNNSWGVEQASQTYFNKHVSELNLSEAALIVGLFQAPSAYDPFVYPEEAEDRRDTVLSLMVYHGYITEEEKELAEKVSVTDLLQSTDNIYANEFQGYIDTVVKEVEDKYGLDAYYTSLEIYTNMDKAKQTELNKVFSGETYAWPDEQIQGGVVAIESNSGKILAVGAGRNRSGERQFNYATQINRQIGSTAKPLFDYGPGIEYDNWSTAKIFNDKPTNYTNGGQMQNYDFRYLGRLTLRYSLQDSRNVPALQAFQQLDNSKIYEFVTNLGIVPETTNGETYLHEAHAIGAFNGASPLQMAGAYAAFSNGGYYYEPYTVSKIVFRSTGDELTNESEKRQAMSDSTAYMITNILQGVAEDNGVSQLISGDLALKTGTTNYDDETAAYWGYPSNATPDGWIAGYTPEITMAMWTGYIENIKGVYLTQSKMVQQRNNLYKACVSAVMSDQTSKFVKPSSAVWVTVEKGTDPAMLPSDSTPTSMRITELFKRGTEPTETSSTYRTLDNVSGLDISTTSDGVKLTWNSAVEPSDLSATNAGSFGYKVYKDGTLLGFTENNYYNYSGTNIYGTYKIVTCYSGTNNNSSSGSTIVLEAKINFSSTITDEEITVGESYNINTDKGKITVTSDGRDVTSSATITTSGSYDITSPGSYKIVFTVSYGGKSQTYTKTLTVKEVTTEEE